MSGTWHTATLMKPLGTSNLSHPFFVKHNSLINCLPHLPGPQELWMGSEMFHVNIWKGQWSLRCCKCSSDLNLAWHCFLIPTWHMRKEIQRRSMSESIKVGIWDLVIKGFRWDSYSEPAVFSLGWQCPPSPSRLFLCLLQKCIKFHLLLSAGVLTGLISLAMGLLSCWHMKYLSHMMIPQSRDNRSHSQLGEAFADQTDLVVETIYCFSYPQIIRKSWLGKQPRWSLHKRMDSSWVYPFKTSSFVGRLGSS